MNPLNSLINNWVWQWNRVFNFLKFFVKDNLPVLVPPVTIQAPAVFAAFKRPFRKTRFSLGWRSKFKMPPWTVISSLGKSSPQNFCNSSKIFSGLLSKLLKRTYWNKNFKSNNNKDFNADRLHANWFHS